MIFPLSVPQPPGGNNQPFVIIPGTGDQKKDLIFLIHIQHRIVKAVVFQCLQCVTPGLSVCGFNYVNLYS